MIIQDLRIWSYVLHKGIIHYVGDISASHQVYIQSRMAKVYIQCDVQELIPLTPEIFKQLKFESNGEHFERERIYITNSKGYPGYIKSFTSANASIGMTPNLRLLQNKFYDVHLVWLTF